MKGIFSVMVLAVSAAALASECDEEWYEGEGTYYGGIAGTNSGNCGIYVEPDDCHHCAMNKAQYDASASCGACVKVIGPKGETMVKVVDQCPECKPGDIDFAPGAFEEISPLAAGRIKIRWHFVPCEETGGMRFKFADGMSAYYFKMAIYGHIYPIARVEYRTSAGEWVEIPRTDYNYYVAMGGIDEDRTKMGPYTFRITATTGEAVMAEAVPFAADEVEVESDAQFSLMECDATSVEEYRVNEPSFDAPYEVYDLSGRRVGEYAAMPEDLSGTYVVRSLSSGIAVKVRYK